jgi:thiazole/oxazole-forming peptide maturase SagD family component
MLSNKHRERLTLNMSDHPPSKEGGVTLKFQIFEILKAAYKTNGSSLEVHEIVRALPNYPTAHILYQLSLMETESLLQRESAFYPLRVELSNLNAEYPDTFKPYQGLVYEPPKFIPLPYGLFVYQTDLIHYPDDIAIGRSDNRELAKLACTAEAYERDSIRYKEGDSFFRSKATGSDNFLLPSDLLINNDLLIDNDLHIGDDFPLRSGAKLNTCERSHEFEWLSATNLLNGESHWLPAGLCLLDFPEKYKGDILGTDSTGCATGSTTEQAIKHAVLEVIERDAAAIWWRAKLPCPEVSSQNQSTDFILTLKKELSLKGYLTCALDITNDLGIPVVATVAWNTKTGKEIFIALGCDLTLAGATRKSYLELMQRTAIVLATCPVIPEPQHPFQIWLDNEHIDDYPQLQPSSVTPASLANIKNVNQLIQHLYKIHPYPTYAVNLTRDSLSPPVVRVFIPKLCNSIHYKGDRLFNMPVTLKRGGKRLTAEDLESKALIL